MRPDGLLKTSEQAGTLFSALLIPMERKPGLYIHIPFCKKKCGYCDFYSQTSMVPLPGFIGALLREMEMNRSRFSGFDTVYLGGGTPSVLAAEPMRFELGRDLLSTLLLSFLAGRQGLRLDALPEPARESGR